MNRAARLDRSMTMTWDDAHDLTVEVEEIDEADIDPADGGDADRPLSPEELEDLYRSAPAEAEMDPEEERLLFLDDVERWSGR